MSINCFSPVTGLTAQLAHCKAPAANNSKRVFLNIDKSFILNTNFTHRPVRYLWDIIKKILESYTNSDYKRYYTRFGSENMAKDKFCSNCAQSRNCSAVYEHLGKSKGPSVVRKVLLAFLLPIAVFIIALAVFEKLTGPIVGFALAVVAVGICILVTWMVRRWHNNCQLKGGLQSQQQVN